MKALKFIRKWFPAIVFAGIIVAVVIIALTQS